MRFFFVNSQHARVLHQPGVSAAPAKKHQDLPLAVKNLHIAPTRVHSIEVAKRAVAGVSINNVSIDAPTTTAVPEPSSVALFGIGMVAIAAAKREKTTKT